MKEWAGRHLAVENWMMKQCSLDAALHLNQNEQKETVSVFCPFSFRTVIIFLQSSRTDDLGHILQWCSFNSLPLHLPSHLSISPVAHLYLAHSYSSKVAINWTNGTQVWSPSVCRDGGPGQEVVKAKRAVRVHVLVNKRRWTWATSGVLGEELILADELSLMDFLPAAVMWVTVAGRRGQGLQAVGVVRAFEQDPNSGKSLGVEDRNASYSS